MMVVNQCNDDGQFNCDFNMLMKRIIITIINYHGPEMKPEL